MATRCRRANCPLPPTGSGLCRLHMPHAEKTDLKMEAEIEAVYQAALRAAKAARPSITDICGPQSGLARKNDIGRAGRMGKKGLLVPNGGY